jgi:hypothetical protein
MKTIVTLLCSAAVLAALTVVSGFALDGAVLFSIGAASAVVAMFASDYSRVPTYDLEPAPVRQKAQARRSDPGVEFATMATFNSMIG